MNCNLCKNELVGLQRRFCSTHCKNVVTSREYNEANKDRLVQQRKQYYAEHTEEIKKQKAEYYQQNIEKMRATRIAYGKAHPEIDKKYKQSLKGKYLTYKRGAKVRNITFDFTLEEFKQHWNGNCFYCNEPVNGVGLDRVDNSIGYTKENTVNCCFMCNRMKHAFAKDDFINKCKQISTIWE